MLTESTTSQVADRISIGDDARILSLAEAVGNMGHWYWHVDSGALSWSDQVYRIFGRDSSTFEPTFASFIDAIHPDDRERVRLLCEQGSQGASFELDARIVTPEGAIRNVITKGQPEADSSSAIVAVFGVVTDVTDAFNTLQAVRDQKEMLDLAARVSGLGHWVWDPDQNRLAYCSDHLAHMFDVDAAHILNRINHPSEFSAFVAPEDRPKYEKVLKASLEQAKAYEIEYCRELDTSVRHYREIGQPLIGTDGTLQRFISTVQDITEAKTREAELEKARHEMEVLVEAKDQLFSIIGHDLKSPFNNIIGFASLLAGSSISHSPEKVQEYASFILEAAENTNALLDTLLAWAAVESADLPYQPVDVTLSEAFNDSVRPLTTLAREKEVTIESALKEIYVKADRDMVLTVFRNLINNAIKFCEAGDQISVSAQQHEDSPANVLITVSDTGIGMESDKISAFLNGRRLETTTGTSGETGSGLGLRICRNLICRQGGDLWVHSNPGHGCQVHFTLPTL